MSYPRFKLRAVTLSMTLGAFLVSAMAGAAEMTPMDELKAEIATVRSGSSVSDRYKAAVRLPDIILKLNPGDVDDQTLIALTSLLDAPEDFIRRWVVLSLAGLGPRAKSAVPKLKSIMPPLKCLDNTQRLPFEISLTIAKIEVRPPPPPPPKCQ